jgi:transitional endoplasmic reticulum ATPase
MHKKLKNIFYEVREPKLTFDDIGGFDDDVKKIVKEFVCLPFLKKDLVKKMHLELPAGIMMWGPLGVGITMLAEAAAKEAGVSFVYVSGQEMLGKGKELVRAFDDAIHEAPCVFFISDTEWLCPRAGSDYEWEKGNLRGIPPTFADEKLSRLFIEQIDRVQQHKDVVLMGSCYRIDTVDQAIIKEKKRFNRKIFVHPPTAKDRKGMLKIYLKTIPKLAKDVDINKLAEMSEGYVGWDIESLCKRAMVNAIKDGQEIVGMKHFKQSVKEIEPWLTPGMTKKYNEIYINDCPHHYAF